MITVPTIALATPPPAWPAGTGFLTKKLQSRDEAPLATRYPRMRTRASTATNDSTATRAVMAPLTMRRRRRRALTDGDGQQHLAGDRGDVGNDHDRENDPPCQQRVAVEDAAQERGPAERG